ncbi:MAG: hypothetical protein HYU66_12110, partial [Armatimonadetes bacterium]|nr:hypothetical protein [Armatimonadota bacterium]
MNKRWRWLLLPLVAVLLIPIRAWEAERAPSGLASGIWAPLLDIQVFNIKKDDYCMTCEAGFDPLAALFVNRLDDNTRALMRSLDAAYAKNKSKHLNAAILIPHTRDTAVLKKFVLDEHLQVPAAVVPPSNPQWPEWRINPHTASTTIFVQAHGILASIKDLPPGRFDTCMTELMSIPRMANPMHPTPGMMMKGPGGPGMGLAAEATKKAGMPRPGKP